jgi:hypothetical protein
MSASEKAMRCAECSHRQSVDIRDLGRMRLELAEDQPPSMHPVSAYEHAQCPPSHEQVACAQPAGHGLKHPLVS